MKLTYWVAKCKDDNDVYTIRTRTKKECTDQYERLKAAGADYDPPKKVTVEYSNGFDLLSQCTYEGRMRWEDEE